MNLTENPEIVTCPETHYVFVEKIGSFMETAPQAWQQAHTMAPALSEHNRITGYTSLYKTGPRIYRAGFALDSAPANLPDGLKYEKFAGGKYSRFVLTGPYTELPQATCRAWEIAQENKLTMRDDFAVENYVNDPRVTPAEQLVTEILIPTE
jgi:effector-binding domain-containing protein